MLNDPNIAALAVIGLLGIAVGLGGGVISGARRLIGTMLMGAIGAITAAAVARVGGADPIYGIGNDFSYVYGAVGALLLSYVVGRSDRG